MSKPETTDPLKECSDGICFKLRECQHDPCMADHPAQPTLLPCPFCGAPAEIEYYQACVSVGCTNDECKIQPTADESTLEESAAAWNQRAS